VDVRELQDGASPDESDASRNPLDNARQIVDRHPGFERGDHEDAGAERDQHVRAQPGRLAGALALVADHRAQHCRREDAEHDPDALGQARQA
jgi:hypothetical protein